MLDYLIRKIITLFLNTSKINSARVIDLKRIIYLVIGITSLSAGSLLILKQVEIMNAKKENREPKNLLDLLNIHGDYSYGEILVGMASSLIFGFIDNASLFVGLDVLKPYLPGGEYIKAGLANTFADVLGFFLGDVIGKSIENYTKIDRHPLWTKIVGTLLGCILGVYIPAFILGKKIV